MKKRKVTIEDVAQAAGVSIATVSRVINGLGTVKERNRRRVQEAIVALGYNPNVSAQRLAGGKGAIISLVIPFFEGLFYSYYGSQLMRSIGDACCIHSFDLLLQVSSQQRAGVMPSPVSEGYIFADVIGNEQQLEDVIKRGRPYIVFNHHFDDQAVSCFWVDNYHGAYGAVSYLCELGHERIAHVTGDVKVQASVHRLEGYRAALQEGHRTLREEYIVYTDFSRPAARAAAERLLAMSEAPTAIFAASDEMAEEVLTVALQRGLAVPRDLSIIGFDNNPLTTQAAVALTTVEQPLQVMGYEIVDTLRVWIAEGLREIPRREFATTLVKRDSTAPARA